METLSTHTIQNFYNGLMKGVNGKRGLSAKTLKTFTVSFIMPEAGRFQRPAPCKSGDACTLPRVEKKELKPLDETEIPKFLTAIKAAL